MTSVKSILAAITIFCATASAFASATTDRWVKLDASHILCERTFISQEPHILDRLYFTVKYDRASIIGVPPPENFTYTEALSILNDAQNSLVDQCTAAVMQARSEGKSVLLNLNTHDVVPEDGFYVHVGSPTNRVAQPR